MARKRHTRSLAAYFKELQKYITVEAIGVLEKGADTIVKDAKGRCPIDTGRLNESIKAEPRKKGLMQKISANATVKQYDHEEKREITVLYGQFVEFDPRINEPFLYPAMDVHNDEIKQNVIKAIQKGCKRAEG